MMFVCYNQFTYELRLLTEQESSDLDIRQWFRRPWTCTDGYTERPAEVPAPITAPAYTISGCGV
jgi:hypothetical protein